MSERKELETLAATVAAATWLIDNVMKDPLSPERGKKIAKILNQLELQNDQVMHHTLGWSFRRMNKIKGKTPMRRKRIIADK